MAAFYRKVSFLPLLAGSLSAEHYCHDHCTRPPHLDRPVRHRSDSLRIRFDQFRWSAPMVGRLFEDDRDGFRVAHDVDAIRSRFEKQPFWPASGATGERR
jgi:hypothetical protein